jgi:hypothetical protein
MTETECDPQIHAIGLPGRTGQEFNLEKVKELLGFRAKGRDIVKSIEGYQVRERLGSYTALFEGEKSDISAQNAYFWDIKGSIINYILWPDPIQETPFQRRPVLYWEYEILYNGP